MKRMLGASVLGVLVAGGFGLSAIADGMGKEKGGTAWKISGDLEEACSCNPACPCWFKAQPSRMTCDGVQAVFIQKGRYGKTPLDGLAVVEFVQSPEGKSMFESFGNWNFENVYIDEKATSEQREALKAIAAHLFPPAAKTREFHYVPITRKIEGAEHSVTVGESGSFSGHLIAGGYSGSPKISNPPLADPTHREYLQGHTTKLTYNGSGQGWSYKDSNYMFNRIKVDNRDYEKFEAEMAKKMAAMK
jgi:hypothetical protein